MGLCVVGFCQFGVLRFIWWLVLLGIFFFFFEVVWFGVFVGGDVSGFWFVGCFFF